MHHGVDECVGDQIQTIDPTLVIAIKHDLDATNQIVQRGLFTQIADRSDHVAAVATEERLALAADHTQLGFDVTVTPLFHVRDKGLEQVGVQAPAQTTIRTHHDVTDPLDFTLLHERVTVLGVGIGQMTNNLTDTLSVGTAGSHALLCLAHLAYRHFLHGAGDLLSTLDTRNFTAYLFCACHVSPFRLACGQIARSGA